MDKLEFLPKETEFLLKLLDEVIQETDARLETNIPSLEREEAEKQGRMAKGLKFVILEQIKEAKAKKGA